MFRVFYKHAKSILNFMDISSYFNVFRKNFEHNFLTSDVIKDGCGEDIGTLKGRTLVNRERFDVET